MPSEKVVFGVPGCGKTTFGTSLARGWIKAGADPSEVAYLGFTKAAAKAAATKILDVEDDSAMTSQFPFFRTIHSLSLMGLKRKRPDVKLIKTADMKQFARVSGMEGVYAVNEWEELADVFRGLRDGGKNEWDKALAAYHVTRLQAQSRADLERARVEPSNQAFLMMGMQNSTDKVYETFVKHYERFKVAEGLIDFTDMLEFALTDMDPIPVKYGIIDESQDLAPLHFKIMDRVLSRADEIFWIGDDDQCQPAGTMVWGSKDGKEQTSIESLLEGVHVLSYDRPGAALVAGKKVLKKSVRPYSGLLYTIEAAGRKTRATANHRFIGRWTKEARSGKECITYLMEKGGRWRVGWCQLFNSDKALHFNIRMNNERASKGWILKVHEDRTDASVHESVVAARYGIPTLPFNPVSGATHMTAAAIEQTFSEIGDRSEQARRCLVDHGRLVQYPLIDREKDPGRKRTTLFETQACNLLDKLMALPVVSGGDVSWELMSITSCEVKDLPVYSLDIEKHHTYVADGIVTHNSLYEWSGASADLFLDRAEKAAYKIELRQTHRYGKDVADLAARIISRVSRRYPKTVLPVEGKNCKIGFSGEFKPVSGDVMVLHRFKSGCASVARAYMEAGIPFRNERGQDPMGAHAQVMAWGALNKLAAGQQVSMVSAARLIEELMPSTVVGEHNQKVRLVIHGAKARLENLPNQSINLWDLVRANLLTSEGAHVIQERDYRTLKHADNLEFYDRVNRNGYDLEGDGPIARVTTIHGAKGREAREVVVFNEMTGKCWANPDAEHRLAYVAATRTQSDLTVCLESKVDWAKENYSYPVDE